MENLTQISGFLNIYKPKGMTSFACIRHLQRILGKSIKIGHAGTLDPFATGVLVVAISRQATREISKIMQCKKEYKALAALGVLTDTLDATGNVLQTIPFEKIDQKELSLVLNSCMPSYIQRPPMFSALKHKGKRLYALARKGNMSEQEMESILKTKERLVHIYQIELQDYTSDTFTVRALVSHGTYIRSLMNDIAQKIGTCATTQELERTKVGLFDVQDSVQLEKLDSIEAIQKYIKPISEVLKN